MSIKVIGKGIGYTSETDISDHIVLNRSKELINGNEKALVDQVMRDYKWDPESNLFNRKSRVEKVVNELLNVAYGRDSAYTSKEDITRHIIVKHLQATQGQLNDDHNFFIGNENAENSYKNFDDGLIKQLKKDYGWQESSFLSSSREKRIKSAVKRARYFIKMQQCSEIRKDILGNTFDEKKYKLFSSEEINFFQKYTKDLISEKKPVIPVSDLGGDLFDRGIKRWDKKIDQVRDIDNKIEELSKKEYYDAQKGQSTSLAKLVEEHLEKNAKQQLSIVEEKPRPIGRENNAEAFLKDEDAMRQVENVEEQIIANQNKSDIANRPSKFDAFFQSVGNLLKKYRIADIAVAYTQVFKGLKLNNRFRIIDLDFEKIERQLKESIKAYIPSKESLDRANNAVLNATDYDIKGKFRPEVTKNFKVTETVARDLASRVPRIFISEKEIILPNNTNVIFVKNQSEDHDSETSVWEVPEKNLTLLKSLRTAIRKSALPNPEQAEIYAFIAFTQTAGCPVIGIVNEMFEQDKLKDYSLKASLNADSSVFYEFSDTNSPNPYINVTIKQNLNIASTDSNREISAVQTQLRLQIAYDSETKKWKLKGPFVDGKDWIKIAK